LEGLVDKNNLGGLALMLATAFSEREVRYLLDLSRRFAIGGIEPAARQRRLLMGLCRLAGSTTGASALLDGNFNIVGDLTTVRRGISSVGQSSWATTILPGGVPHNINSVSSHSHQDDTDPEVSAAAANKNPLVQPSVQEALKHYLKSNSQSRAQRSQDGLWHGARFFRRLLAPLGLEDCIFSVVTLPQLKPFMGVVCLSGPLRPRREDCDTDGPRRFTVRQRRGVHVAHGGLRWVYYPEINREQRVSVGPISVDLDFATPVASLPTNAAADLAPRHQKVLSHLLAGGSEKALADQLGLSRHTIHEYVRAIYRKFNVNSRSELMAQWVGA
jgi:DNA-binding CsgD family transcriptional regulator